MKNKPLLLCFGTRPEWLKVKPLVDLMNPNDYKLLFTGQHMDLLKDVVVDYKIYINNSDNRLDSIVASCIMGFPNDDFSGVLIQGDTGSAFGCAISAFNRKLKIYYMEAGLRSYDLDHPYPEEGYRQMIARISDVNFSPTQLSADNLISERILGKIHVVGNTVLDNLIKYDTGSYGNTILVTLHRRENHHWIDEWFKTINQLAIDYSQYKFVLPIHPNPNVQKYKHLLTNVNVIEPMTHDETIKVLKDCKLIITDSGGLQEEGSFFNKKVIVCRKTTERPEGIDTGHLYMCNQPYQLKELFEILQKNYFIDSKCPYGDGNSSEKILKIINYENNKE